MVRVQLENERQFKRMLEEYARKSGKEVAVGIKEVALSSARELTKKVQPYGITSAKGEKFIQNIGRQVDQVYIGVNLGAYPATNDIESAHRDARRNGVVRPRKFRKQQGQPWLGLIKQSEKEIYKRKQQAKAGRAKGAWVEAGNSLRIAKLSGIPKWISRNASAGYGGSDVIGTGWKTTIMLWNRTPYLRRIQKDSAVQRALADGRKNGFRRLEKILQKLNKTI